MIESQRAHVVRFVTDTSRMNPTPDHRSVSERELGAHLLRLAVADDDDRAELLCDIIERCWDEQTLRQ